MVGWLTGCFGYKMKTTSGACRRSRFTGLVHCSLLHRHGMQVVGIIICKKNLSEGAKKSKVYNQKHRTNALFESHLNHFPDPDTILTFEREHCVCLMPMHNTQRAMQSWNCPRGSGAWARYAGNRSLHVACLVSLDGVVNFSSQMKHAEVVLAHAIDAGEQNVVQALLICQP